MMQAVKEQWPLILGLSALAMVRPLMSILGWLEAIGQPTASIAVTLIISAVWLVVVLSLRVHRPLVTLTWVGVGYGLLAIILSAVLSPLITGHLQGPITNPFAVVSVLITNGGWGLLVGSLAALIRRGKTEGQGER
ncbi:hypothetical protein SAMN04488112_101231 [Melghirimyces thermohalophilus]|uniref:Uncharacterized protein n=1 Tax=Melghirimyces thermohalophilus TaxID=1236220 RepID=A0A1G6HT94_9BACL|nr:hypothetical protein [Melghirimyces thermohalophilus]SDB97452.1 hypothetical protein SAMN04488112_101231 [Melghirimyces thermohalophilus]